MKRKILFAVAVCFLLPIAAFGQQCGGVERWAVKVASDSQANLIDVVNPVPITLHDLVAIPRPAIPSDEDTRAAQERTVYVVSGRLVRFKLESGRTGDSDFHLVITDDTLQYTPGGNSSTPAGHSFVAEIVDPDCVSGRHGNVPTPSRFQTELQAVYAGFRQRFPNISGGWNEAGGIPVTITGIGFFDRPHGQTGRSPNGIEIHPILNISFDGSGAQPPPPVSPNLLLNPDFEAGAQSWTASAGVVTNSSSEPARSGAWKAWLGGYGETHTDTLYQQVAIPANAHSVSLSFYLHISSEESTTTQQYDKLQVQVRSFSGQTLTALATYSNLLAQPGFHLRSFDLSQFRGQTVRVYFKATEDNGSMTSFVLDDLRLSIEQ